MPQFFTLLQWLVSLALIIGVSATMLTSCPQTVSQHDGDMFLSGVGLSKDRVRVLEALNTGRRTPEGFYSLPAPPPQVFPSYYHLKTTDLPGDGTPRHDLCADNDSQAFQWTQQFIARSDAQAELQGSTTTPLFFEYGWINPLRPQIVRWLRVFDCRFLDRASHDWDHPTNVLGQLNHRPLDAQSIRTAAEYLWFFSPKNNYGYTVLDSANTSTANALTHTITEITQPLETSGVISECKTYLLIRSNYNVASDSGLITLDESVIDAMHIRKGTERYEFCS